MNKTVCVTGCAGYLGDAVVDSLLKFGYVVLAIDNLMYGGRYMREHPHMTFARCDVRDTEKLGELFAKHNVGAIVHLAAFVGDGACAVNPELTIETNERATVRLAELCKKLNSRLVFASTCSVYGAADTVLGEESQTNPLSLYAGTKLNAEAAVKTVSEHVIFRLGTLFGLSAQFGRLRCDLVTNILTYKAVEGNKLTIFGGAQWRPLLHVRDAAHIMAEAATFSSIESGIYNLSCGNFTVIQIARTILNTLQMPENESTLEITSNIFEDQRNYCVSTKKVTAAGVRTLLTLEDGIKEMAAKARSGTIADLWDKTYHNASYVKERYDPIPH